jgi:hypothetical protein
MDLINHDAPGLQPGVSKGWGLCSRVSGLKADLQVTRVGEPFEADAWYRLPP